MASDGSEGFDIVVYEKSDVSHKSFQRFGEGREPLPESQGGFGRGAAPRLRIGIKHSF